jgi:hypothetical protein
MKKIRNADRLYGDETVKSIFTYAAYARSQKHATSFRGGDLLP